MRVCTLCRKLLPVEAAQCPADGATAELVSTLPAGTQLGQYRIERLLGEGGMGFVYEATHVSLGRRSAIKMLRPELAQQSHIVTRFLNEARAVNVINHQNTVNVYDFGDGSDGSVYFVMEFLEGETLDDLLYRRQPLPVPLLLHLFTQIAKALAAAHAQQIVHRDLKPANVFVVAREDNPYFIKLLDFGIAQLRGAGAVQGLTLAGSVMGTPQYMSPEQVHGGTIDARSDLWACGVMLYRAATGHPAFRGEEFAELAEKILYQPIPPPHELAPIPPALSQLIMSCLERRLEARCPSAGALVAGLERVQREQGLDADALLAAVIADAGRPATAAPARPIQRTNEALGGSRGTFQDLRRDARGPGPGGLPRAVAERPRSRGLLLGLGAGGGVAIGVAAFLVLGGSPPQLPPPPPPPPDGGIVDAIGVPPDGPIDPCASGADVARAVTAGDQRRWRELARDCLIRSAGAASSSSIVRFVGAVTLVRAPSTAPILYAALERPGARASVARALAALRVRDAAPKLTAAFGVATPREQFAIAGAMLELGEPTGRDHLQRELKGGPHRAVAALALARAGDRGALPALGEHFAVQTRGTSAWRETAEALLALGDAGSRAALQGELSEVDEERRLAAAATLAAHGDAGARSQLAREVEDAEVRTRGVAALALARLGERAALDWARAHGLASPSSVDRQHALAVLGTLAAPTPAGEAPRKDIAHAVRQELPRIAALAGDPDPSVRWTAEAVLLGL
jgi:serine/threonine-protein kinase